MNRRQGACKHTNKLQSLQLAFSLVHVISGVKIRSKVKMCMVCEMVEWCVVFLFVYGDNVYTSILVPRSY